MEEAIFINNFWNYNNEQRGAHAFEQKIAHVYGFKILGFWKRKEKDRVH